MDVNHALEALKMNVFIKHQSYPMPSTALYPEIGEMHKLSPLGRNYYLLGEKHMENYNIVLQERVLSVKETQAYKGNKREREL